MTSQLDSRAIDLSGQVFGRLTVIGPNGRRRGGVLWKCQCACGAVKDIVSASLRRPKDDGGVRSCGCLHREAQVIDESGKRYGRWLVRQRDMSKRGAHWFCVCDCGSEKSVFGATLRDGSSASCGCTLREKKTSSHPLYSAWRSMIARCDDSRRIESYSRYWGRGIRVCDRWQGSFQAFCDDMGPRPPGLDDRGRSLWSIDRVNPNGNYEPGNVRWATAGEQTKNRALSEPRVVEVLSKWKAIIDRNPIGLSPDALLSALRYDLLGAHVCSDAENSEDAHSRFEAGA